MNTRDDIARTRRAFIKTGGLLAGSVILPHAVSAAMRTPKPAPAPLTSDALRPVRPAPVPKPYATVRTSPRVVRPDLMRRAMAALDAHSHRGVKRDRIVIADFAAPSSQARFHFVDLVGGKSKSLLVSHGSGSDPAHTGWLQRFSNREGSNATSEGAYLASDYYVGKHGRSQRLIGLDHSNDQALQRAIVVHAAWYANPSVVRDTGVLGRSQGCFAVGEADLDEVFARLGEGRMIYAAKV